MRLFIHIRYYLCCLYCLLSGVSPIVLSAESITDFHVDILVLGDGSINVTETIAVNAEGVSIQRGIFRDFPTLYKDRKGNNTNTTFDIIDIQRNGISEPFHTEKMNNTLRVYIGDAYIYLDQGHYIYQINYISKYQLGFLDNIDELYWNVTGNGWSFPIEKSSARITLPRKFQASQLQTSSYQGKYGSKESARMARINGNIVEFEASRPLNAGEGLTVAVGWPAGSVQRPSFLDTALLFPRHHFSWLISLAVIVLLLVYYVIVWHAMSVAPDERPIIPRYHPASRLSPAAHRYILKMYYDDKAFVTCLVSLAVKGYLTIGNAEVPFVSHTHKQVGLDVNKDELALLESVFSETDTFSFGQDAHEKIRGFFTIHKHYLEKEYLDKLFVTNSLILIPAFALSFSGIITLFFTDSGSLPIILFITLALLLHTVFYFLLKTQTLAGRKIMRDIEGFREYLHDGERDRTGRSKASRLTSVLFEKYLPYAIALDVDNAWCEHFRNNVAHTSNAGSRISAYQPSWYAVSRFNPAYFGAEILSLSSAIGAASSLPGSNGGADGNGS